MGQFAGDADQEVSPVEQRRQQQQADDQAAGQGILTHGFPQDVQL